MTTTSVRDMSIAHFGTTLIEAAPADGVDQASVPMTGDLARTDRFLRILGAELQVANMYPGVGRQYIYGRGHPSDPDYFEKDTFTSYTAVPVPALDHPRVGDMIFRLPHRDPKGVAHELMDAGLIKPLSSFDAFMKGDSALLWFTGPDGQQYELSQSADEHHENHRVYIWTDPDTLEDHEAGYAAFFDLHPADTEDFHGVGDAHLLVRRNPGITIALLTPRAGSVAPKHSFDIFRDAGYSHFRLGSPDKARVRRHATEAFPDGGGPVAYVHFQNAYLELVQVGEPLQKTG